MTKIEQLYNSIQTLKELGVQLPQGLIEETNRVEEEIIKNDIIPALAETISPIIEQIQRGIILVVEYVPNEPLTVKLTRKRSFAIPEEQDITEKKTLVEKETSFTVSPQIKEKKTAYTKKKMNPFLPQHRHLLIPIVKALKLLGGLGTIKEIDAKVFEIEQYSAELLEIKHLDGNNQYNNEIEYRLAWAKTKLKKYGILENPERGMWSLADFNINEDEIDCEDVMNYFRNN
jgi:hypothetical protein